MLGLYIPNSIDTPAITWGVHWCGGIVSPANPGYTVDELAFQLKDSGARALITNLEGLANAKAACKKVGISEEFIALAGDQRDPDARIKHFTSIRNISGATRYRKTKVAANDLARRFRIFGRKSVERGLQHIGGDSRHQRQIDIFFDLRLVVQNQRGFRDALISLGYTVRTKILKEYYDDSSGRYSQKANLDIEIVVDMFNTVEQYDRVILFSGDGDFERAIELLRSKNTHITVVSTEGMIARELRNVTDRYIDLNDIRETIEKVDG